MVEEWILCPICGNKTRLRKSPLYQIDVYNFVSGDLFNGDLLKSVLKVEKQFWKQNEDLLLEDYELYS